jgi:hypothetical protein
MHKASKRRWPSTTLQAILMNRFVQCFGVWKEPEAAEIKGWSPHETEKIVR